MTEQTDITIIGAGPVGLFAVFQAGMLGMRCHVVDTLEMIGGQCSALYPEKPIYDIPGHPSIDAQGLIDKLEAQAAPFGPVYHLGQQVMHLQPEVVQGTTETAAESSSFAPRSERDAEGEQGEADARKIPGWRVTTSKGTVIDSKVVVIAAGCGAFGPNRPPLSGIEAFEGTSVHYLVQKREQYRGKRIVIAGGGDSAVDWAISLSELAASVAVVHRRPKFRAAPESVRQLDALAASGKVEMVVPYQLHALEGEDGRLSAVIAATLDGQEKRLEADVLLPFFGLSMELGPIAEWGLGLHKNHIAVDASTLETSAAGIYAIGDIATYKNKLKLILCGFSEAAMAVHAARARVFPDQEFHFEYSTTSGVPAAKESV